METVFTAQSEDNECKKLQFSEQRCSWETENASGIDGDEVSHVHGKELG